MKRLWLFSVPLVLLLAGFSGFKMAGGSFVSAPPVPISISFTPSAPSISDNFVINAQVATINIQTSDGSQFAGAIDFSPPVATSCAQNGNSSGLFDRTLTPPTLITARNGSPADDGTRSATIATTQNGTTICAPISVTIVPQPVSPDGSFVVGGAGGSVVTAAGTWTLDPVVSAAHPGNYSIELNSTFQGGASGNDPSARELYVLNGGILYQQTAADVWYSWTGSGPWTGPITHPVTPDSPTAAVVGGTTQFAVTDDGVWTLPNPISGSDYPIRLNGVIQNVNTKAVNLFVMNGGILYQQTSANIWYSWTPIGGPWVGPVPDPHGGPAVSATLVEHKSTSSSRYMAFNSPWCYYFEKPQVSIAGNAIIASVRFQNAITPSVTDDVGNTYSIGVTSRDTGNTRSVAVLGAFNVAAGARRLSFCFPSDPGQDVQPAVTEFSNVTGFDGSGNVGSGTSATASPGVLTPTQVGDVIYQITGNLGCALHVQCQSSWAAGSSMALLHADTFDGWSAQYGTNVGSGAVTPSTAMGTSTGWLSAGVLLKTGTTGSVPPANVLRIVHELHTGFLYNNQGFIGPGTNYPNPTNLQFPSSGNLLVAQIIGGDGSCCDVSSITSVPSQTWQQLTPEIGGPCCGAQTYYVPNAAAANNLSLSATWSTTTGDTHLVLYDLAGASTSPLDTFTGNTGNSAVNIDTNNALPTGYTITTAKTNEMILSIANWDANIGIGMDGQNFLSSDFDGNKAVNGPALIDEQGGEAVVSPANPTTESFTWRMTRGTAPGEQNNVGNWTSMSAAFQSASSTTGGGPTPPPGAMNANFTTLAANFDFTQTLPGNWLDTGAGDGNAHQWYPGNGFGNYIAPPGNVTQITDGANGQVLNIHWSDGLDGDGSNSIATLSRDHAHYTDYPNNAYYEIEYALRPTSGSTQCCQSSGWMYNNTAGHTGSNTSTWENDIIETAGSSDGYDSNVAGVQFVWLGVAANLPAGYDPTQYNKYGYRLTSDGNSATACSYITLPGGTNPTLVNCVGAGSGGIGLRNFLNMNNGRGTGPVNSGTTDMYIRHFRVWSCADWQSTDCNGALNPPT